MFAVVPMVAARNMAWLLLVACCATAVVHLVLVRFNVRTWAGVTKPLPILCLIGYALVLQRPWLLVVALLCSVVADVLLEFDRMFLGGMALFGLAHIAYVALFAGAGTTIYWAIVLACLLAYGLLIGFCWRALSAPMRAASIVYGLLLCAMTVAASGHSLLAGVGGALFLVSDSLLALRLARVVRHTGMQFWVMVTYLAAQLLLVLGYAAPAVFGAG